MDDLASMLGELKAQSEVYEEKAEERWSKLEKKSEERHEDIMELSDELEVQRIRQLKELDKLSQKQHEEVTQRLEQRRDFYQQFIKNDDKAFWRSAKLLLGLSTIYYGTVATAFVVSYLS